MDAVVQPGPPRVTWKSHDDTPIEPTRFTRWRIEGEDEWHPWGEKLPIGTLEVEFRNGVGLGGRIKVVQAFEG